MRARFRSLLILLVARSLAALRASGVSGVGGGFDAELTRLRGLGCTQADVVVVVDFDLTLTSGTSEECHDIVGTSALMPKALRKGFERLLDFDSPFPPELDGEGWWVRANELLVESGAAIDETLPAALVRAAHIELRPGAAELLLAMRRLGVPVLVVSAGITQIIEAVLDEAGVPRDDTDLLAVSSNRLVFGDGTLVAVEPSPPVTSLNKGQTCVRNRAWFGGVHAARRTLVVGGDRLSDLSVGEGAAAAAARDGHRLVVSSCGVYNDTPHGAQPPLDDFAARFDTLVVGDHGSLAPLLVVATLAPCPSRWSILV